MSDRAAPVDLDAAAYFVKMGLPFAPELARRLLAEVRERRAAEERIRAVLERYNDVALSGGQAGVLDDVEHALGGDQ